MSTTVVPYSGGVGAQQITLKLPRRIYPTRSKTNYKKTQYYKRKQYYRKHYVKFLLRKYSRYGSQYVKEKLQRYVVGRQDRLTNLAHIVNSIDARRAGAAAPAVAGGGVANGGLAGGFVSEDVSSTLTFDDILKRPRIA